MKFKLLNSVLRLYEANIRNLHWNSEYYEMFSDLVDEISEIMGIFDETAPNYVEVLAIIKNSDKDFLVIDSNKLYSRADIIKFMDVMFEDIRVLLVDVLSDYCFEDHMNDGVKSKLEDILYDLTFQQKYINKRRLS